jgi:colanic acid biosynthesis glycosyl transferase WcaI
VRILVIVPHYRPDGGPGAPLFTMLCEELVRRGDQVTVLTTVPHYPSGQVLEAYRGRLKMRTEENGVRVVRVVLPSVDRRNFLWRLVQFAFYQIGATLAGWREAYDVLVVTTAALQVWLPYAALSVVRHKPAIYSVHDVYPDIGVNLGVFRHKAVIRVVAGLEDYCLRHAAAIRILSESFVPRMLARGVPESKLNLIYDWVDTDLIRPLARDNSFAREHNLVGAFVVLYAGNIGFVQGLEYVLESARLLVEQEDVRFVFVGDGAAREGLIAQAQQMGLPNVQFLPYQPLDRMPEILAAADVSLVSLLKGMGSGALPSKSFSILASGRPLLASIDPDSDLVNLVQRASAGICVPPQAPDLLAEAILRLKNDPALCAQYGQNGRAYALEYHSESCYALSKRA